MVGVGSAGRVAGTHVASSRIIQRMRRSTPRPWRVFPFTFKLERRGDRSATADPRGRSNNIGTLLRQ
jgi:hypothetical protein